MASVRITKLLERVDAVAWQRRLADNTTEAYGGWIHFVSGVYSPTVACSVGEYTHPTELTVKPDACQRASSSL